MLELRDLNVHYDMIHAIKGISLTVEKGEIVTLIGANGAGKTTTLRTIAGLKKPTSAPSGSTARTSPRPRRASASRWGLQWCPRAGMSFPR